MLKYSVVSVNVKNANIYCRTYITKFTLHKSNKYKFIDPQALTN